MGMVVAIIGSFVIMTGFAALFFVPLWALWNWVVPAIFGLPAITIWQSLGLCLLISLLSGMLRSDVKLKAEHSL